jgi:hypothetical protein
MTHPNPNADEAVDGLIGSFHKTLPHDAYGEVEPRAYMHFRDLCLAIESGMRMDFEGVVRGVPPPGVVITPGPGASGRTARLTSPLAGAAAESFGPEPRALEMRPAPGVRSISTAAEMVELYWMAVLRDASLARLSTAAADPAFAAAAAELKGAFQTALDTDSTPGALRLGEDLPATGGALDLTLQTLFRCGLPDEQHGPLVSQFFLRDIPYGTQRIDTMQYPYAAGRNYLTRYEDWLLAQNTGKDRYGRSYGECNFLADDPGYYAKDRRHITTMRDLARFVNRDALHQAYFNAALFLDAVGAPLDAGNPYRDRYARQGGFATLGGPDLLTLVSEVASRALKVVWRQKWLVHRRARPEVYGGLVQMQLAGPGLPGTGKRDHGLPDLVTLSIARGKAAALPGGGTSFLPMAFSAGSPAHPAYGAGHATVAGACVTILKAWFDEHMSFEQLLKDAGDTSRHRDPPGSSHAVLQPGALPAADPDASVPPAAYTGADRGLMTVGGELNKLASNVAMGRSMGGVHWRSDNTRSLRLGEQIAIEILRKRVAEYAEKAVTFTFTSFDRKTVHITAGGVTID